MAVVLTITLTNADGVRAMNALCDTVGVAPTQAAALQVLRDQVVQIVKTYERSQAVQAAVASVADPVPIVPT